MGLPPTTARNSHRAEYHRRRAPLARLAGAGSIPWIVFALTFGLLLSDYMSRQVLSAVFPFLKAEWDTVRFAARLAQQRRRADGRPADPAAVAAGGSVGPGQEPGPDGRAVERRDPAVRGRRAATSRCSAPASSSAWARPPMAASVSRWCSACSRPESTPPSAAPSWRGGSFGSVIGVALGGVIAVQLGWRWSFAAMAIFGLILVAAVPRPGLRTQAGPACRRRPTAADAPGTRRIPRPDLEPVHQPRRRVRLHRRRTADVHRRRCCWPGCRVSSTGTTAWPRTRPERWRRSSCCSSAAAWWSAASSPTGSSRDDPGHEVDHGDRLLRHLAGLSWGRVQHARRPRPSWS